MRTARAELERSSVAAPGSGDGSRPILLGDLGLSSTIDGPMRHPRAGLRNAFPAHAVRVLRPKVP
ncbi:MAG TPA: hypothetical protein VL117_11505 [Thermoleophilia bacterium]|nr:hypothetical protein [Thermoleophilia bacterium]